MFFIFGFIAAGGLQHWATRRLSAILVIGASVLTAAWLMFVYYRTDGIMHDTGFGDRPTAAQDE